MRQAPDRWPDSRCWTPPLAPTPPNRPSGARPQIALARGGRFAEVLDLLFPVLIHRNRQNDVVSGRLVRLMADDIGPEAFIRQQQAIIGRPDPRPRLAGIGCRRWSWSATAMS